MAPSVRFSPSPSSARWPGVLAWAVATGIALWLLSGWVVIALTPPLEPLPPASLPQAREAARAIAARQWFGSDAGAATALPSDHSWKLLGVSVGSGRKGPRNNFAVLRDGSGTAVSALEGSELVPGVTLASVRPDAVILDQAGSRREIRFDPPLSAASARSPAVLPESSPR